MAEYADLARPASATDPGGEVAQIAKEIATLNDTIARQITAGDSPNDLLDRRDLLLDQLSEFGQVSVEQIGTTGAVKVSFVDAAAPATTYPVVDGATATWAGPPAGDAWSPGGRLGALLDVAKPGGTLDQYRARSTRSPRSLISTVNGAYGGTFLETATASNAGGLRVNPALVADAVHDRGRHGRRPAPTTSPTRSRRCATAPPSTAPTVPSWPASAPTSARPSARTPTPRR